MSPLYIYVFSSRIGAVIQVDADFVRAIYICDINTAISVPWRLQHQESVSKHNVESGPRQTNEHLNAILIYPTIHILLQLV